MMSISRKWIWKGTICNLVAKSPAVILLMAMVIPLIRRRTVKEVVLPVGVQVVASRLMTQMILAMVVEDMALHLPLPVREAWRRRGSQRAPLLARRVLERAQ